MAAKTDTVSILGVDFLNSTRSHFLKEQIYPSLLEGKKCFIVTANPEIVMRANEDEGYNLAIQSSDYVVPDGAGIIMAAKYQKTPLKERVPGYDLTLDILNFADKNGLSCFFLGAREDVNRKAVYEIEKKYPNLKIAGRHHGFFDLDDDVVVDKVVSSKADAVFVALGLPRQEQWIASHYDKFSKGVFMGIGGSLDVIAGTVKRAPDIWIRLNLEWLYRLLKQPTRLKRIIKVFEFMIKVIIKK